MLTYPILEWWADLILGLPNKVWGFYIILVLLLGILRLFGIQSKILEFGIVIMLSIAAPLGIFYWCYVCKLCQGIPIIGFIGTLFRIATDIGIVVAIIRTIKYFRV